MTSRQPQTIRSYAIATWLWRSVVILVIVVVLPASLWWFANRFDEAPTPLALKWAEPIPLTVTDRDNAWLLLAGMGAAVDEDPVAYARRKVDVREARMRKMPVAPANASERALFEDPTPVVAPDPGRDWIGEYCPSADLNCLDWATINAGSLEVLREANALRLERWDRMLDLPAWQNLYSSTTDEPLLDESIGLLRNSLLARDAARAIDAGDSEALSMVTTELVRSVEFWHRMRARPGDIQLVLLSGVEIENSQRLIVSIAERIGAARQPEIADDLEFILRAPEHPTDWTVVVKRLYHARSLALGDAMRGPWASIRHCFAGNHRLSGCLAEFWMASGFARQATMNIVARQCEVIEQWLDSPPGDATRAAEILAREREAFFPPRDDVFAALRFMAYNVTGKTLAAMAIPATPWAQRLHDQEALRRMLVVKIHAMARDIHPAQMPDYVEAEPDALRDPFTGTAFQWEPLWHEIRYVPASPSWRRAHFNVRFAEPIRAPVRRCDAPVTFTVSEVERGDSPVPKYVTCDIAGDPSEDLDPASPEQAEELAHQVESIWPIETRRDGARFALRLMRRGDDGILRAYEIDLLMGADVSGVWLDATGHANAHRLHATFRDGARVPYVSLNVSNMEATDIAREIAQQTGTEVRQLERLGRHRVTLHGDLPIEMALELLAVASGISIQSLRPGVFVYGDLLPASAQ